MALSGTVQDVWFQKILRTWNLG